MAPAGNAGSLTSLVLAFLLVLARVGGALAFVPLPGVRQGPRGARAVLAGAVAIALYPAWPRLSGSPPDVGTLAGWLLSEAALGITAGLAVAFLNEGFSLAAQIFGLPAGYSYAATIDPATEAESTVLLVLAQLAAGLLFFALDMHLELLRVFARSLEVYPPGSFALGEGQMRAIVKLGAGMFAVGVRLAMPVIALLLLVDVALSLLSRIHAQLQLLMMAFPVKMLAALAMMAATLAAYPRLYRALAAECAAVLGRMTGYGG